MDNKALNNKSMNSPRVINQFHECSLDSNKDSKNFKKLSSTLMPIIETEMNYNSEKDCLEIKKNSITEKDIKQVDINSKVISNELSKTKAISDITEEKLKELTEKNEKLEKECLKFKIQLKSMENKVQEVSEKNYKSTTNTSSKFILPSEFKQMWDSIAQENIIDTFIDVFTDQRLAYFLISEFFYLNLSNFRSFFESKLQKVLEQFKIPIGNLIDKDPKKSNNKNKVMEKASSSLSYLLKFFRPLIEEFFENIFYDEEEINLYSNNIKDLLLQNVLKQTEVDESLLEDLKYCLNSDYFKTFVNVMKKISLYCEMHEPPLKFEIDNIENRKPIIKFFKNSDIICVDGLPKENKLCLVLVEPPILKNNYYYMSLKPIVIVYNNGCFPEEEKIMKEKINTNEKVKDNVVNEVSKNFCKEIKSESKKEELLIENISNINIIYNNII